MLDVCDGVFLASMPVDPSVHRHVGIEDILHKCGGQCTRGAEAKNTSQNQSATSTSTMTISSPGNFKLQPRRCDQADCFVGS